MNKTGEKCPAERNHSSEISKQEKGMSLLQKDSMPHLLRELFIHYNLQKRYRSVMAGNFFASISLARSLL